MSLMKINPETGYPEIMPDTRIPPGGHTLGGIGGLAGLQPQPLDPQQQIQEIMQVGDASVRQFSPEQIQEMIQQQQVEAAGMPVMNSGINISQEQMAMPQVQQQALPGTTGEFGPLNYRQPTMQEQMAKAMEQRQRSRAPVPRPPKAEGLGVSSFGGASSNDMQRMLNRGSISGNNMGDVQNQIGEMEAAAAPQPNPNTPRPPNPFLAGNDPQQYPIGAQIQASRRTAPPAGGIMGQAPPEMAQNIPLMQNQMAPTSVPSYGLPPVPQTSAGMGFSPPPMNPMQGGYGSAGMMGMAPAGMAQMAAFPQQTMQQGGYAPMQQARGSQNSPPIQSPFV